VQLHLKSLQQTAIVEYFIWRRNYATAIYDLATQPYYEVEVCMGMGKTGIPWVPWDSHGNGNKISHGMGMGWEWE